MCLCSSSVFRVLDTNDAFMVNHYVLSTCTSSDPGGKEMGEGASCGQIISRQLTEQGRFAYAALCGVSLGQLFNGPENR